MRKINLYIFLLFFTFLTKAYPQAQTEIKIDSIFASYNSQTPGVAIAVVKNNKIVFKKGYGMANLNHNIPVTTQTVFNIASVSKQFTAFTIYLLQSEGKLSFEDDIRIYISELPKYETPIKIKHLLAHTSGLRDYGALASISGFYTTDVSNTESNLKLLSQQKKLNFIPGSQFGYCNSNYILLAEIVHRISGKTFREFANEKIFIPLGMTNTQVLDNSEIVIKNKAESYELSNGKYFQKQLTDANTGSSNVLTTVEDLSKWVLNFDNPIVGKPQLIKAFNEPSYLDNGKKVILRITENDTIFHAKGQNISKDKGKYLGHGGHTAGFRTFLGRYPEHNLAIIQLSNDEDNEKLGGRWDIADYYIEKKSFNHKPNATIISPNKPSASTTNNYFIDLNDFTGKYFSDELDTQYYFEIINSKLVMKHKRLYDITLKRIGEEKFSGSGSHTFAFEISFIRDKNGEIEGFEIANWGVKQVFFKKMKTN